MKTPEWFQQTDHALIRAAARARALAAMTNTPIHFIQDGKILELHPKNEESRLMPKSSMPPEPAAVS